MALARPIETNVDRLEEQEEEQEEEEEEERLDRWLVFVRSRSCFVTRLGLLSAVSCSSFVSW